LFETFLEMDEAEGGVEILPDALGDQFAYLAGKDFGEINRAAFAATLRAHAKRMPVAVLKLPKLDAEGFGELFYFFAFSCVLSCKMMGVNPFDQPGVEAYKERMFAALGKGR
ncbi:MAG: glucose-6-phosphate isomerase, partial [Lachnospiraceae bacterium]|nr:glucose-6-phosphate isomerase [Lachnospiraceae bacterium]